MSQLQVLSLGAIVMLEDFLNKTAENKEKKLSKTNTKAFNAVKQRLKKNNREWEEQIRKFRESGCIPGEDLFDEEQRDGERADEEQESDESWDESGAEPLEESEEEAAPTSGGKFVVFRLLEKKLSTCGIGSQWLLKTSRSSKNAQSLSQKERKKSKTHNLQQSAQRYTLLLTNIGIYSNC